MEVRKAILSLREENFINFSSSFFALKFSNFLTQKNLKIYQE